MPLVDVIDRLGRPPAVTALAGEDAVYVVGGLACWAAPSVWLLVAGRLLQALGAGSGPVVGRAVVRDLYAPERAARVLGYMGTAMALTPILAPIGTTTLRSMMARRIWQWRCTTQLGIRIESSISQ